MSKQAVYNQDVSELRYIKLHKVNWVGEGWSYLRVPGGLVYNHQKTSGINIPGEMDNIQPISESSVFVPFTDFDTPDDFYSK